MPIKKGFQFNQLFMAYNIIAEFFKMISPSLFDTAAVLFIIGFIIWELPRTIKILPDEYSRGVYPEAGRVVDFVLLAAGLAALGFLVMGNVDKVVSFLKIPGVTGVFIVLMVVIPLIIAMGFFKRAFARMDQHNSVTVFIAQGFLDLSRTVFHIALVILSIPVVGFLLFAPK